MKKNSKYIAKPSKIRQSRRKRRTRLHLLKFIPALLLIGLAFSISIQPKLSDKPHSGVLSYATSISPADLLAGTNNQRGSNGLSSLSIDSQLMVAAQTKANDMVNRNYWSHVTPDGREPWTFITDAGYQYTTAGENLAYGFDTSADTITGWMNSAPHRANVLNNTYTQVGFGIANSADFNNDGQQTVVVAMYASPQAAQQPAASPALSSAPPSNPQTPTNSVQDTAIPGNAAEPVVSNEALTTSTAKDNARISTSKATVVTTKPVKRVQILTGGKASWSAAAIVTGALALGIIYTLQRGLRIKKLALAGERFIVQHLYLDVTVAALIILSITMVATVGKIR